MRIPRIYTPGDFKVSQTILLEDTTFQYAIKVLRLKQGHEVILFDGKGNQANAIINSIKKKTAKVLIKSVEQKNTESKLQTHLGLAISRGERMDYAIQKSVELGINEITPLFSEYSVVNLDNKRLQKKHNHWTGIIISACEQCGRNTLPTLHPAISLINWAESITQPGLVLDPLSENTFSSLAINDSRIAYIIGPEGGLSTDELEYLNNRSNFKDVNFGPRILRTETAAVSVLTALQFKWGDLKQD